MKRKETHQSDANKKYSSKDIEWLDLDEDECGESLFCGTSEKESEINENIPEETIAKAAVPKAAVTETAEFGKIPALKKGSGKKTAKCTKETKRTAALKNAKTPKGKVPVKSRNRISGIKPWDTFDRIIAAGGVFVMVFAILTCSLYASAKSTTGKVASFEEIGAQMEGISVIGESGLLAIADAQAARTASVEEQSFSEGVQNYEEKELEASASVEVEMHLSSMQKDLKIKFVNKKSGKLVPNVAFEVTATGADGKSKTFLDDDMDGIIYQTDMTPGKCNVELNEVKDKTDVIITAQSASVTIKDKIEYKKVDVTGEIKKESEVNAAAEDTKQQVTEVESVLTDTVGWVESTKTPVSGSAAADGSNVYEEVSKDRITDPMTLASAVGFFRMAAVDESAVQTGGNSGEPGGSSQPNGSGEPGGSTGQPDGSSQPEGDSGQPDGSGEPGGSTGQPDGSSRPGGDSAQPDGNSGMDGNTGDPDGNTQTGENNQGAVTPPQEIKVSLSSTTKSLKMGESFTVNAVTEPAGNAVTWASSNAAVAAVDNGVVTALGAGTANITAVTADGHSAMCSVTVTEPVKEKPVITINEANIKILTGKTKQLTATVKDAEDITVAWSSNNEGIAVVSADGQVKGVGAGTAVITAVCNADSSVSVSCEVIVKTNPETDNTTKLKDNEGNQLYIMESEGKYREAVYSDYYKAAKFYKKSQNVEYKYTGWQTIDGKTYYFDANGNKVTGEQIIQGAKYNFDSDGALSVSSGNMGIDVSKWNGNIDWNAVKNSGVSYVIIRCGYRGSTTGALIEDPKFRSNIQGATAAGLKVGVYFFTQAVNESEAVEEASMVASLIGGYRISYPVFLDVEPSGGRADGISKETRTAVCRAFCQTMQNSGYTAGIYANKTWLTSYINTASLTNYKIWLAQYAAAPTYSATKYDMWQYSSKGSVAGISGKVDMNMSYLGY